HAVWIRPLSSDRSVNRPRLVAGSVDAASLGSRAVWLSGSIGVDAAWLDRGVVGPTAIRSWCGSRPSTSDKPAVAGSALSSDRAGVDNFGSSRGVDAALAR
ncbi:hypothetical protein CYMTET_36477, partial [Cymbomonas tetramitiformis]